MAITLPLAATHLNLECKKGDDDRIEIPVLDRLDVAVPLTSAKAQVRAVSGGALLHEFSSTASPTTAEVTTGLVTLVQTSAVSAAWTFTDAAWELEVVTATGKKQTVAYGRFTAIDQYTS